jgi:hypothetical protein
MSVGLEWDLRLEQHRADPFFIRHLVFKKQNAIMQLKRRQGIQWYQLMNCTSVGKTVREKYVLCWPSYSGYNKCSAFIKAVFQ